MKWSVEAERNILRDFDYTNKLIQVAMNSPNVLWKLLDIVANDRKGNDPSAPELLYRDSAGI